MAQIIDIRERLKKAGSAAAHEQPFLFHLRLCGPDRHWIGLVGGILAGALEGVRFRTAFASPDAHPASPSLLDLYAGRPTLARKPPEVGLLVAAAEIPSAVLTDCTGRSLLLAAAGNSGGRPAFPGIELPLPLPEPALEPLEIAAICAGAAARLLGAVGWRELERSMRAELTLAVGIDRYLALAFVAYHQLAPWAGLLP